MKLYYSPGACSMASHIILNELGYTFESESVDLKSHTTQKGKDFYTINPKGYVPALVLDNGQILTEGVAILTYLAEQKPSRETVDRYKFLEWLVFISSELHKGLGSLFGFKDAPAEIVKMIKDKVAKRLELVDQHFASHDFIIGKNFGPADAYLFTVLSWCPHLGIDLSPWKNVTAFLKRTSERPAVQKTLKAEGLLK